MFRLLPLTAVAFALTLGCRAKQAEDTARAVFGDCDPMVLVPAITGGASVEALADPHSDTFGASPEPVRVRYQWPSSDPSTSAAFLWATDVDTLATVVEYGVGDELTERVEGASYRYGGLSDGEGDYRIHEVRLCGLVEPGTTYSYRVGGEGHWSETYQFTTPGAPGTFDTFRVAISGDSRGAYETWGTLLATMDSHDPDFFMFSGDMVELGVNQYEWDAWFDAAGDLFARKVMVPAHGNHEFLAVHYFAQFALPSPEEWFHIDYGDLTLVSLNDTVRDLEYLDNEQVALIDGAFADNTEGWRIAMHHQSIYSTCTTHGSYDSLRDIWEPAFDRNDVHLVFAGHNHIYERSVPIRDGEEVGVDAGTTYFVSGGAGAPLYTGVDKQWFGSVANPIEHYLIADFGPDEVTVTARDLAGNVLDEFTRSR